jgi:hypothetical protein
MPIRREYRWFYPIDWPQLSAAIRLVAKGRCEHCRRPHSRLVFHLGDGRWWDEEAATWRNGRGRALSLLTQPPAPGDEMILTTKVVLATAHLDHNPSNNKTRNLKACCQHATCCMTAKSIAGGGGSLFERRMLWAIYSSGALFRF